MEISYRKIPIFKIYFKKKFKKKKSFFRFFGNEFSFSDYYLRAYFRKKKKGFKMADLNGRPTKKRRLPIM